MIWGGGAIVLGVLWWLWRPLLAATVDADLATVAGLKPERARLIFGLLVAGIIAVAIKIVGILLIVALLIVPAATVRRFAPSPEWMAAGAALAGVVVTVGGALRVRNLGHAVRSLHRRGRAGALHRDPGSRPAEGGAPALTVPPPAVAAAPARPCGPHPAVAAGPSVQPSSSICTVT